MFTYNEAWMCSQSQLHMVVLVTLVSSASTLFAIMARRGRCLFWAAVCGLALGCVLGVVDDGTMPMDVPHMDSSATSSATDSFPVGVDTPGPLGEHETGCATAVGVPPTAALPATSAPTSSSTPTTTSTTPSGSCTTSSSCGASSPSSSCMAWLRTSSTTTSSDGGWDAFYDGQPNPEPIPDDTATVWNTGGDNNHGAHLGDSHGPAWRRRDG